METMLKEVLYLVKEADFALEDALAFGTSNVAKAIELYPKKGCVAAGSDADLLLLDAGLSLDTVIARGRIMMQAGTLLAKGTYEEIE